MAYYTTWYTVCIYNLYWNTSTTFNSLPQSGVLMTLTKRPFENIVIKEENAGNQYFLLYPQCLLHFQKFPETKFILQVWFISSSAKSFKFEQSKILSFGKEWNCLDKLYNMENLFIVYKPCPQLEAKYICGKYWPISAFAVRTDWLGQNFFASCQFLSCQKTIGPHDSISCATKCFLWIHNVACLVSEIAKMH